MGLFDSISNMVTGAMGGSGGPMADQLTGLLQDHGINGVSGLVQQFQQSGMGEHVASWVGTGQNLPISADQINAALGSNVVASIAGKLGIDPAQASQLLSQHLPAMVDNATPTGDVPADSSN
jgi:uncharacterized protein YidB (DUF937 family)